MDRRTAAECADGHAAHWQAMAPDDPPSHFRLATREVRPVAIKRDGHGILVDFGQETSGVVT